MTTTESYQQILNKIEDVQADVAQIRANFDYLLGNPKLGIKGVVHEHEELLEEHDKFINKAKGGWIVIALIGLGVLWNGVRGFLGLK